jgi:AraC-like DNA-binding protein
MLAGSMIGWTAMTGEPIEIVLAKRFRIERPPTILAHRSSPAQIGFSRILSAVAVRGRSLAVPREAAFSFHVPMSAPFFSDLWTGGRRRSLPAANLGDAFLFDLGDNPVVELDTPFDSLRFYVTQQALNELAQDRGIRPIVGLHKRDFGGPDPVLFGLAQTLATAMAQPRSTTALFADCIALAFFAHIAHNYGDAPNVGRSARGGLAPWQFQRAAEFINAHLNEDPSVADLAKECGLSISHFGRAFRQTTGMPPHQWLTGQRVERAKALLSTGSLDLAEVAEACGFTDQSHFTRVFSRFVHVTPGRWRRQRLN